MHYTMVQTRSKSNSPDRHPAFILPLLPLFKQASKHIMNCNTLHCYFCITHYFVIHYIVLHMYFVKSSISIKNRFFYLPMLLNKPQILKVRCNLLAMDTRNDIMYLTNLIIYLPLFQQLKHLF